MRPAESPERVLAIRLALVIALVVVVLTAFWLDRDNLYDASDGSVSLSDIVYFTMVTITTVGYGDIVPVGDRARLLDAFLVTPIRILVWFVFLGTAYEFIIPRIIEQFRMKHLRETLEGHVIICGYGFSGRIAAREMIAKGYAREKIVIIDEEHGRVAEAAEDGFIGLRGDAAREAVLREAATARAKALLVCVSRDDTTVLIVLTASNMNKSMKIIASVREEENAKLIRNAGANVAISPSKVGGFLMADAVDSIYMVRFISDALSARGRVSLVERIALETEVGRSVNDLEGRLVVGIDRGGKVIGFWDDPKIVIEPGDRLLVIESK